MGHRANLILVERVGTYALFYTHWRANTLDSDLFWGPASAEAFIRAQRSRRDGAEWLDDVWGEGGAVLDLTRRELVWFGGEDIQHDVPLRRVHLGIMRALWEGWTVRWAAGHVWDLHRHVGRPVAAVWPGWHKDGSGALIEPQEPDWITQVVSMRAADGRFKIHAQNAMDVHLALGGERLLRALRVAELPERYDYAARTTSFPDGGVHVDEMARRVTVWCAAPLPDPTAALRAAWRGWQVEWLGDRYEGMCRRLGDRLVLPTTDEGALVAEARGLALREPRDRSGIIGEILATRPGGGDATVNPFAARDDMPVLASMAERAAAFDRAVARWRTTRSDGVAPQDHDGVGDD